MTTIGDVRKIVEAAVGKLSPAKAQELARSIMHGEGKDQIAKAAQDLQEWSNKNRQRLTDLVRSEVRAQLSAIGVASKDEVDALKKRVRELERGGSKRSTAKKRSVAKKASARKPAAKPGPEASSMPAPTGDA